MQERLRVGVRSQIASESVKARTLQCGFWPRNSPNSDLNYAVDFGLDFSSYFFQGKRPQENPQKKIPRKIHPEIFGSKQKGPAEQVAPRVSSLKICRF